MRIDKFLATSFGSRTKAAHAVESGLVTVNGKIAAPSYDVKDGDKIEIIKAEKNFVSLGGFKLDKALNDFSIDVSGKIFADVGSSTGGFCDCLLQSGAKKVYCIDVGENQLDKSLLSEKVVVIDNFNARNLNKEIFSDELDGVTVDVSFISLTYILEGVASVLNDGKIVLTLIKPQFECNGKRLGKSGILKDKKAHEEVISKIYNFANSVNLAPQMLTNAPIKSGKNLEYVIYFVKGGRAATREQLLKNVVL